MTRILTFAKTALAASIAISVAIIGGVHYKQYVDRLRMHDGIIRDVERQQKRKLENTFRLQEQRELTKIFKRKEEEEQERLRETNVTSS